ncbi:MAG: sensor histidine kinase [Spirochaetia bacterium]
MKHIRLKFLRIYLIAACIPIFFSALVNYGIFQSSLENGIRKLTANSLKQISGNVEKKLENVQIYMDFIWKSPQITELLRNTDFSSKNIDTYHSIMTHIDDILDILIMERHKIELIVYYTEDRGHYAHDWFFEDLEGYFDDPDIFRQLKEARGKILWMGERPNPRDENVLFETSYVLGKMLKDVSFKNDYDEYGYLFFFLRKDFFDEILTSSDDSVVLLESPEGTVPDDYGHLMPTLHEMDERQVNVDGKKFYAEQTSFLKGSWNVYKLIPYKSYMQNTYFVGLVVLVTLFSLILLEMMLSIYVTRRITRPILKLYAGMKKVGENNLKVKVEADSDDEIGRICKTFNAMVDDLNRLFKLAVHEEREKQRAKITALQYQINPHFLYNTLAAIRLSAIEERADKSSEMLLHLSRVLRKTVSRDSHLVSFSDERDVLMDFIELIKHRYLDAIDFTVSLPDEILRYSVPSLLLQPLVENAINHGLHEKINRGDYAVIIINGILKEDKLIISVFDNGIGMNEENIGQVLSGTVKSGTHIGIRNISERIQYNFGEDSGIYIKSEPGLYTEIEIRITAVPHKEGVYVQSDDS